MRNNPCACPPGKCLVGLPDAACVNRDRGNVVTARCFLCVRVTWHKDGKCLHCADCLKRGHIHA